MGRSPKIPLTEYEEQKLLEAKIHLCRVIRRAMDRYNHPSQTKFALRIGTSRANVCRVQKAQAEDLSFNQLFRYLVRIAPDFEILISV